MKLDPTFIHAYRHLVDTYFILGSTEQLVSTVAQRQSIENFPQQDLDIFQITRDLAQGLNERASERIQHIAQLAKAGRFSAVDVAHLAAMAGDFNLAGEMLLQAYREKDGTWLWPHWVRLPEQAPDSEPWQAFWQKPGVAELAELRRSHGFTPSAPSFGSGGRQ